MSFCLSCQKLIPGGREELAKHIRDAKKGHGRGKRFAARILTDVKRLDRKATLQSRPGRIPLTESQKETKKDLVRQVSGQFERTLCVCGKCGKGHEETLEIEYLQSQNIPRSTSGKPVILCSQCRK